MLEEALNGKRFRLELKYRGTRDGFRAKNFHKVVDGMQNTLLVVESEHSFRFGGYISVKRERSINHVPDLNAVIFSLTNKSVHRQYQHQRFAICPGYDCFGGFGDFDIKDNCNTDKNSCCYFGTVYRTPNGIKA